jgi:hypothetical protein
LNGGTLKTWHFCEEALRSHLIVSIGENDAVGKVRSWLSQFFGYDHPIPFVLNVAGPRESKAVGIQESTRRLLINALQDMIDDEHVDVD